MNEKDLNIKYIREKTGLVENDELIPIILEMIQESYKAGLCQAEYDNTMGLVEENKQLKDLIVEKNNQLKDIQNKHKDYTEVNILQMKLEASEKARKEAIELLSIAYGISVDYDGFNDVAGLKAVIDDMARAIKKAKIVLDIDKGE